MATLPPVPRREITDRVGSLRAPWEAWFNSLRGYLITLAGNGGTVAVGPPASGSGSGGVQPPVVPAPPIQNISRLNYTLTATTTLRGLTAAAIDGQLMLISNLRASVGNLLLNVQDGTITSDMRFSAVPPGPIVIAPGQARLFIYNGAQAWQLVF